MNAPDLDVGSATSYAVALLLPAGDAVFPVLPSELAVIALGVATAGSVDPRIGLLVALAAVGAFLGDNLAYLIGRRFAPQVERRFFSSAKAVKSRQWAERSLEKYGARLIVACRFVPGGRTAVTLSCGLIRFPRKRFIFATLLAGSIWASYAFFIGRIGGHAFANRPWAGFLVAFGTVCAISALIETVRRLRARHAQTALIRGET